MSEGDRMIRVHLVHQLPDGFPAPDVYFTAGYGRAASVGDGGEWVLLEGFDGAGQVPLIVRNLANGAKDAISPYGYSGVYASPDLSSWQIQDAWSASVARLRELDVIGVLLRHSPLVPQAPNLPDQKSIVNGHPTIVLEPADSDSAWSGMEGNYRTATRKAQKNGYTGAVRQAEGTDLAPGGDFRRLYEQTMGRVDAARLYFFSDDYYQELLDGLGSNLLIAEVQDREGAVVSSALLMRHEQLLHYHLSGSSWNDAGMGSNNLMIWTATQFAIGQGLRQFHIGSGVGPADSLFKFKRSFGGHELEHGVSGLIVDPCAYRGLVEIRAKECDTTADVLSTSNFFPAYRGGTTRV